MRDTTKLLSILALGSALGGCSMAGTGDYFADQYAQTQTSQSAQYWGGGQSSCQSTQTPAPTTCGSANPVTDSYGQAYQGQAYQGQAYQGQTSQLPQTYAGYQGQPAYPQTGYAQSGYPTSGYAPAYVNAQGNSARGLRRSYTYGTLGATLYDVDSDLYGAQARLGWQSKGLLGAEVEGSLGVNEDEAFVDFGTGFIDAESGVDTQIAGFAVARYPVSNKFNVLGRVGYHNTEFDAEFDDGTSIVQESFSTDGIAYGAGLEYAFNPLMGVRADYTRYDLDGATADAVSLAVTRKF